MKRILPFVAAPVLAAVIFSACGHIFVPARPDDYTLDFWITEEVSYTDFNGYMSEAGWFGASAFYTPDSVVIDEGEGFYTAAWPYLRYICTAWPDYSDGGMFVTTIEIADPEISLYGITCNSSPEQFSQVLTSYGYEIVKERAADGVVWSENCTAAEYGRVTILLTNNGMLCITALVTNREGIVF